MPSDNLPRPEDSDEIDSKDKRAIEALLAVSRNDFSKHKSQDLGNLFAINIKSTDEFRKSEKKEASFLSQEKIPKILQFAKSSIEHYLCQIIIVEYLDKIHLSQIEDLEFWNIDSQANLETDVFYNTPEDTNEYLLLREIIEDSVIKFLKMDIMKPETRIIGLELEKEGKLQKYTTENMHYSKLIETLNWLRQTKDNTTEFITQKHEAEAERLKNSGATPIENVDLEEILTIVIERVLRGS